MGVKGGGIGGVLREKEFDAGKWGEDFEKGKWGIRIEG